MKISCLVSLIFVAFMASADALARSGGVHLVTYKSLGFATDESEQGQRVKAIVDQVQSLGFKTVIINVRAHMVTGTGSEIKSVVPVNLHVREEKQIEDLAKYVRSKGMNVALRPIVLVVGPKGEFPYVEKGVYWWHGNIKPKNINQWFESLYSFHYRYFKLAQRMGAEWYSIGAEMHSMTVGFGERDKTWSLGYPEKWVEFIKKAREAMGGEVKITYALNYTDQYMIANGSKVWGGELEQWRHFMFSDFSTEKYQKHQQAVRDLWSALDIIGIDYYRAFAGKAQSFSRDHKTLVSQLLDRPKSHADQLDTLMTESAIVLGQEKPVYFQEMGFRSADKSFLNPSAYEDAGGAFNPLHQAAAWEAFFKAYWKVNWPWMAGVGYWQVQVDEDINQKNNTGFTPFAKPEIQKVLREYLL